jgi:anti-sigma B factor antagonist
MWAKERSITRSAGGDYLFESKGVAMKITTRSIGDVRILDCSGKITLGEGMLYFRNTLHNTLSSGANKIVLNLAHTKYIDQSGIDELINSYNSVTHDGGQLRLLNLTKKLSDPLVITNLMMVFKSFNDEKSALASFN